MDIVVSGATGALGRHVATIAAQRGHTVIPASRANGIDIRKQIPAGDCLIHCATKIPGAKSVETAAARFDGRVVYPSIVAIDEIHFGYYKAKLAAEKLLSNHPDHAIIRFTQFHEFAERFASFAIPMVPRNFRTQSMGAVDAASLLVDAAEDDSQGRLEDAGGPEVFELAALVAQLRRIDGKREKVWTPSMGKFSRDLAQGHNLHAPRVGAQTWQDYLQTRV